MADQRFQFGDPRCFDGLLARGLEQLGCPLNQLGAPAGEQILGTIVLATELRKRQNHLGVGPYQRSAERQGYANGYKPKTVTTRVGEITFAVPQVRDGSFYPHALEKGLRSERALTLTLAEMYVQGVSTRKVAAITHQRCPWWVASGTSGDIWWCALAAILVSPPAECQRLCASPGPATGSGS